jgi:mRNA-degrading endonuclease RelE of RelBE toxin-antitoxin system
MKWTVVYLPSADSDLADIWMDSSNRQAVSDAADIIGTELSRRPLDVGESREGKMRLIIQLPLIVFYDVVPDDLKVTVWHIKKLA